MGLYVHLPFCRAKCHYCDFNSVVASTEEVARYLQALEREIQNQPPRSVATVYFGGGTPTVCSPEQLGAVLKSLGDQFSIRAEAEITCEANPGTVTGESLLALRRAGFNRLSLGVQSLHDDELRLLGRIHTAEQARDAVVAAREAGFTNLSLDLLRGLPGQSFQRWRATVEGALALAPDHISVYGLTLEEGTPLLEAVRQGRYPWPRNEEMAEWVAWTVQRLEAEGFRRYEISNYARPGYECRHNLNYWEQGEYVGLGAGAWSYLDGERRANLASPAAYASAALAGEPLTEEAERLGPEAAAGEAVMLGLRKVEGVDLMAIRRRYGVDVLERHKAAIQQMVAGGFMVEEKRRIRLTFQGMLVHNVIATEFVVADGVGEQR